MLLEESDERQRLRGSHPCTGLVTPEERAGILANGTYGMNEDIADPQGAIAREIFRALATELDLGAPSLGGGIVLAARCGHRTSLATGLFRQPDAFGRLDPGARVRIRERLKRIPGCDPERTWCEQDAVHADIDEVEVIVPARLRTLARPPDGARRDAAPATIFNTPRTG